MAGLSIDPEVDALLELLKERSDVGVYYKINEYAFLPKKMRDLYVVDRLLERGDPMQMLGYNSVALLRTTYRHRHRLLYWDRFRDRTYQSLEGDPRRERTMTGLMRPIEEDHYVNLFPNLIPSLPGLQKLAVGE